MFFQLVNSFCLILAKSKDLNINFEIAPAGHLTKKFILNPVKGSRLAPARNQQLHQSILGIYMIYKEC